MLRHSALSQDLPLKRWDTSQDPSSKCWDTSYCPRTSRTSVGTLGHVPRPSVGTLRTVPRPLPQMLGHFALSQDPSSKCWDTSYCPRTSRTSVGTLGTVPRPSVGTLRTVPRPLPQMLGHFALSQDPSSKCWDTSYCPTRASRTSVGTLGTVSRPSVGTIRNVPRPLPRMMGHFERSQDLPLKCWDTSHCIKT